MKNRCKIDTQKHRKVDAKMAPKIRPRAACARRGVVDSGCLLLPLHALSLKGTLSSHSSSALSLLIVCRRHLSLIWVRNNFFVYVLDGVLCRMQACRATPPHPILGLIWKCFCSFSVTVFDIHFLMVFSRFYLPFFNAFSMNFRCISHHSFWCFSGTFFQKLSCRISFFFEGLLFERHAFYTVNTMVLTHSAPPKKLVFYFGKKRKYQIFA